MQDSLSVFVFETSIYGSKTLTVPLILWIYSRYIIVFLLGPDHHYHIMGYFHTNGSVDAIDFDLFWRFI